MTSKSLFAVGMAATLLIAPPWRDTTREAALI